MKNFNILWVHGEIQFLMGERGVTKNQYCQNQYWEDCLKRGYGQFVDLRGIWQERWGVFEGEGG